MRHIINAIVENQPGVLARIVGVISGRGYNIETLAVAPSHEPELSRLTMTVRGDSHVLEQVTKQLNKMVNVIKVNDLTTKGHLERELILVEVATPREKRAEVIELINLFRAEVICVRRSSLTIQHIGTQADNEDLLRLLQPYTILDLSRSGPLATTRGDL